MSIFLSVCKLSYHKRLVRSFLNLWGFQGWFQAICEGIHKLWNRKYDTQTPDKYITHMPTYSHTNTRIISLKYYLRGNCLNIGQGFYVLQIYIPNYQKLILQIIVRRLEVFITLSRLYSKKYPKILCQPMGDHFYKTLNTRMIYISPPSLRP